MYRRERQPRYQESQPQRGLGTFAASRVGGEHSRQEEADRRDYGRDQESFIVSYNRCVQERIKTCPWKLLKI